MRDFSDAIKFSVVRDNLEKNHGKICCEICGKDLHSIGECHFDHITSYAKGGKSSRINCQILCVDCNLKKNDKELNDFLMDKKARDFLDGKNITNQDTSEKDNSNARLSSKMMTKEKFDEMIRIFLAKKGTLHKVDFVREYNNLPSIHYVREYYGNLSSLRRAFHLQEQIEWNRENIKDTLSKYIEKHGNIFEKDLKKTNSLPSYPCILKYYPEYKGLNNLKRDMFSLNVREKWNKEKAIVAGKEYVTKHGRVTQKDLISKNNLPTANVIYRYFGTMEKYQEMIGSKISKRNELFTMEYIDKMVDDYFKSKERVIDSRKEFLGKFPISESVICKNFNGFANFCKHYNITCLHSKKAKYTKQEIDDLILHYIKEGNSIPTSSKKLAELGLPSRDAIMRYYEDWHEPFILYEKMFQKMN